MHFSPRNPNEVSGQIHQNKCIFLRVIRNFSGPIEVEIRGVYYISTSTCCGLASRPLNCALSLVAMRCCAGAMARSYCAVAACHNGCVYGLYCNGFKPANGANARSVPNSCCSWCGNKRNNCSCTLRNAIICRINNIQLQKCKAMNVH